MPRVHLDQPIHQLDERNALDEIVALFLERLVPDHVLDVIVCISIPHMPLLVHTVAIFLTPRVLHFIELLLRELAVDLDLRLVLLLQSVMSPPMFVMKTLRSLLSYKLNGSSIMFSWYQL